MTAHPIQYEHCADAAPSSVVGHSFTIGITTETFLGMRRTYAVVL
jgi:hypothetical protein